ncbi:MAG: toll/interleukin-1 receptor domain-containing protein [Chloroflexi bacterium]|nr:toll/interleukin-1 receptor domain-containing protein [Chloroflexota bacterium]
MAEPRAYRYDVFISHADADRAWVEGYLLDALEAASVRVHSEEAFRLGVPRILEFERAIRQSQRTLLILSPAHLAEGFSQFTDLLAQSYGLETATWPVIPLILHPVQLPPRLAMLTALDASDPDTWPRVLERLLADLGMVHNWLTLSQPVENSDDMHSPKTGGKRRSSGRFTGFCSVTRAC